MSRHAAEPEGPTQERHAPTAIVASRRPSLYRAHELGSGHGARVGRGGRGAAQSIINPALISALGTPPFTTEHTARSSDSFYTFRNGSNHEPATDAGRESRKHTIY